MLALLNQVAEAERLVCDTPAMRRLWYKELVRWVSPTEVGLTSAGLSVLYRALEAGEL